LAQVLAGSFNNTEEAGNMTYGCSILHYEYFWFTKAEKTRASNQEVNVLVSVAGFIFTYSSFI
jgi:hypothetical protein